MLAIPPRTPRPMEANARTVHHRDEEHHVMALLPTTINGKIEYYRSKNAPWTTNATAIGTTTTAVTALATKVTAAQTKLDAQVALQQALKNATADLHQGIRDMTTAGGDIVRQVRAKAAIDGPGVYILAQIPAPATPSTIPAPGTPSNFKVGVRDDGSLALSWKCANPSGASGTVYQLSRQVGVDGELTLLGVSGARQFIDATLPAAAGAAAGGVTYQVIAIRSTIAGAPAQFVVKFGVVAGTGQMMASVVSAPKLAA